MGEVEPGGPDGGPSRARLLLLLAACGWSLSGVIIKSSQLDGLTIAWSRSAIAAIFLLPWAWRRRQALDGASCYLAAVYLGTVTLLVLATKATTAANAIVLQYIAPAIVFPLGIAFLGERPTTKEWLALGVSMSGVGVIFVGAPTGHWLGIALGVGSGVFFGLLIVGMRRYRHIDPVWVICFNNACVAVFLAPWVNFSGWEYSSRELILMLVLGIVQLGIPYVLFYRAVRQVTAREAALVSLLEPLLNPIWVVLVVGEVPLVATQVGGLIVLAGVVLPYLSRWSRSSKQSAHSTQES
jgi:drug/metabolite transporter, DME family